LPHKVDQFVFDMNYRALASEDSSYSEDGEMDRLTMAFRNMDISSLISLQLSFIDTYYYLL
jgi:hypothetical protein